MTRLLLVLVVLLLAASACTLGTADQVRENSLDATQTALPLPGATSLAVVPTKSGVQPTPVLQSLSTAANCGKLRVDVGTDPGNTLRLREQPNNSSTIILLIPNNTLVTKVPSSQEVNAGGYNWVNIQYTDPNGIIATGWAARDAVKNRVTLRQEGC